MKKNWYKGLTATAISLAMAGAAVSVPAFAIEYDLANGDVYVSEKADGTVESWQTDGNTYEADGITTTDFYYKEGETEKTLGRYQHTQTVDGTQVTDTELSITQSGEGTTDNTVTISGDLKGDDTTAADDVDITIKDVNVETGDTFLTVEEETTADISIENSTITATAEENTAIDIDGSDVTLSIDNTEIEGNIDIDDSIVTLDADEDTKITGNIDVCNSFVMLDYAGKLCTTDKDNSVVLNGNNTLTIDSDLKIDNAIEVKSGESTITINGDVKSDEDGIVVRKGADVTLNGSGSVTAGNDTWATAVYTTGGKVTIDGGSYNGYAAIYSKEGDVTINNGNLNVVTSNDGSDSNYSGSKYGVYNDKGNLHINNVYMRSNDKALYNDAGNVEIKDGTFISSGYTLINLGHADHSNNDVTFTKGVLTINDGTFKRESKGYLASFYQYSEAYVYGGEFASTSGIAVMNTADATVTTSSNLTKTQLGNYENLKYKLTDEEYACPTILVWGKPNSTDGPSLHVSGAGIFSNFWHSATDITINSGSIISDNSTAIYHPQQGKFIMNGGYLQGATGIEAKMGHFIFNGGYVVGTGAGKDNSDYTDILGGTTANGAALKFELYYYGDADTDKRLGARGSANQQAASGGYAHLPKNNDFSLTITDGVFISKNNAPITVVNWNMCEQDVKYSVTGGRFSGLPKTIEKIHDETDGTTLYGIPIAETVSQIYNYLGNNNYYFTPAAYYDGVGLEYGFVGKEGALGADAPYYASLADAIADRNNDPDARAYIYYLLNNGLDETGSINRQLQIFYDKAITDQYLSESAIAARDDFGHFGYSFNPANVQFNNYIDKDNIGQYILTNYIKEGTDGQQGVALWSPAVFFDPNGGTFADGSTDVYGGVLADAASGKFDNGKYGHVVSDSTDVIYMTYDELGEIIELPADAILVMPESPTREGYNFLGWFYYDSDGNIVAFDPETMEITENMYVFAQWKSTSPDPEPEEPYFPPYQPKPNPKPVEPDVPDIPEEPTPVQPVEPVTPSIPDEVIDDIIDEVEQLTSVPKTGAEEEADDYAAAAVPAGVLALAVAGLLRRKRRAE